MMKADEAIKILKAAKDIEQNQFTLLQVAAKECNADPESRNSKELVLRSLEHAKKFTKTKSVLNSLVREIGLFPYLEEGELSLKDSIAFEYHRPENLDDIVFHQEQMPIYQKILDGKNIVLSAPTSFGKSKIIDGVIAAKKFRNIVIVVPTLALIDETRRRLTHYFGKMYNVVAHPSQMPQGDRNIFIFTPERVNSYKDHFPDIDFFVIDEFYKIGGQNEEDRRVIALNQAFYYLYKKKKAQFYMLGPNIQAITEGADKKFNFEFISTDFNTVITETTRIFAKDKEERLQRFTEVCYTLREPTLIYCKSIGQAYELAEKMLQENIKGKKLASNNAKEWLAKEFHEDWILPRAIEAGIGLHYGPLPRSIAQEMVRLFNSEKIQYLVCTSTLIEGVNTKAKNVIIYENKIAKEKLDYFTFNNIKGRSGRMFEHFVGRVIYFEEEPQQELPLVDFPLHSQGDVTSESLLIHIDPEDLNEKAKERVENRVSNSPIPVWILKENNGIEPEAQVAVYDDILDNSEDYYGLLSWKRMPTYKQLEKCCSIIWSNWIKAGKNGVFSAKQLTLKVWNLKEKKTFRERIENELKPEGKYSAKNANEAVERVLSFDRNWAGFDFPQYLMALDRIQRLIYEGQKKTPGDYSYFATQVESLFRPSICGALDEFGIPINLSEKCEFLFKSENLKEALEKLKKQNITALNLHPYEKELLIYAQKDI